MSKKETGIFCPCCQQIKKTVSFSDGYGIQTSKKLPYCKQCNRQKLEKYQKFLSERGAFWTVCSENGIPFIKQVYDHTQNTFSKNSITVGMSIFDLYIKYLKQLDIVYNGFWDSNVSLQELEYNPDVDSEESQGENAVDMERRWGKFDNPKEAYPFLEELFKEYTENIVDMDTNLRNRYRDLCKAEYAKRKAEENGDVNEISKAQDNIIKLLKLLKLDNFQETSVDPREKFIDRIAWMIENEEPAEEEDKEKYRDIAGFEKSFKEIMRSLKCLLTGSKDFPDIPREER